MLPEFMHGIALACIKQVVPVICTVIQAIKQCPDSLEEAFEGSAFGGEPLRGIQYGQHTVFIQAEGSHRAHSFPGSFFRYPSGQFFMVDIFACISSRNILRDEGRAVPQRCDQEPVSLMQADID